MGFIRTCVTAGAGVRGGRDASISGIAVLTIVYYNELSNYTLKNGKLSLRIALIGAGGATGSQILSQALAAGHSVRVLVRDPQKVVASGQVEVIVGDILDREVVRSFITENCEAVVSALGIVEPKSDTTTFSVGMENVIAAMHAAHVSRLLAISASGFHTDKYDTLLTRIAKPILCRFFKHTYADLARMESLIQGSDTIDWTIFIPPRLLNRPARGHVRIAHGHNIKGGMQITRADLATIMLQSLTDTKTFGEMVFIAN